MKNLLKTLAFIAFLVAGLQGFAQTYHPLPDSNAYWLCISETSQGPSSEIYTLKSHKDDTLINGKTYTRVYLGYDTTGMENTGAFRNDPAGKTYYIHFNGGGNDEYLVHDFTANVGDTIHNVGCLLETGAWIKADVIVDSVGYHGWGPYTLKWLRLKAAIYSCPFYWTEGIGSNTGGLLNLETCGLVSYKLDCHSHHDTIFFNNGFSSDYPMYLNAQYTPGNCPTYDAIPHQPGLPQCQASPNPFSQTLAINGLAHGPYTLVLYNHTGSLCLQITATADAGTLTLDTRSLSNGLYFLCIYTKNQLLCTQRIIKQE